MVLMKSDLRDVVTAIDLSRKTYNRIRINFLWAFLFNALGETIACLVFLIVLGIPLAAGVFYPLLKISLPPMVAGGAMAFSSVAVVSSSLLLNLYRPPKFTNDVLNFITVEP